MTVEELCRLLSTGWVDAREVPEIEDVDIRTDVQRRAASVGQRLFYSASTDSYGFVLDGALPEVSTHRASLHLDRSHRALIATCWLHLRWLPAERARAEPNAATRPLLDDEPSISLDDLAHSFKGQLQKTHIEQKLLPVLKRLGYLQQRDGRLFAGPLLDSLDAMTAAERARELMLRYQRMARLQRRSQEIDAERAAQELTP